MATADSVPTRIAARHFECLLLRLITMAKPHSHAPNRDAQTGLSAYCATDSDRALRDLVAVGHTINVKSFLEAKRPLTSSSSQLICHSSIGHLRAANSAKGRGASELASRRDGDVGLF
jgi:hypothetical protein